MRFVLSMLATGALAAYESDRMGRLPDAPAFPTDTYSGYLSASETRKLHYVFAESESDPASDPVVIWFNGGPGCSSMLAFMQENGPLAVDDGEDYIKENPEPWTRRANMLWIESPAGVGWSTAETAEDWSQNDMTQSRDAFAALEEWYAKFPEFKSNPLFVSGESYGGVYVPYMAWQIYQNNLEAAFHTSSKWVMPLEGIMVGNGATNWNVDVEPSFPATVRWFNVVPPRMLDQFEAHDCHYYFYPEFSSQRQSLECDKLWAEMNQLTADLNWYDLYRPVYPDSMLAAAKTLRASSRYATATIEGRTERYKRGMTMAEYTPWVKHLRAASPEEDLPILGDYLSGYMNRQDVRRAFNIPSETQAWEMCSDRLDYHEQPEASFWIYPVLRNHVRLMFYSGDTDGAVTTYGSKRWIKMLDWPVEEEWRPWYTHGQVSGYVERYDGLDFVTVKGVGHMAPQWAREPVTNMISAWIHNETF